MNESVANTSASTESMEAPASPVAAEEGIAPGQPMWVARLATAVLALAMVATAELVARQGWVSDLVLPAPSNIWNAFVDGFRTGIYWEHLGSTLGASVAGFLIAAVIGISLAGVLVMVPRLEAIVMPFIVALQGLPKVALAPLVILWLGFGLQGKTFVVVLICFFPILINSLQGLRMREREQFELAGSLGASRFQIFRYIRVPNAVPYIFAAFRISVLLALIGAIVAEFVGSRAGLGYLMIQQRAVFNVPGVFAILLILMFIGLSLYWTILLIERKVAFWTSESSVLGPQG